MGGSESLDARSRSDLDIQPLAACDAWPKAAGVQLTMQSGFRFQPGRSSTRPLTSRSSSNTNGCRCLNGHYGVLARFDT
jgi:hypothetical protein